MYYLRLRSTRLDQQDIAAFRLAEQNELLSMENGQAALTLSAGDVLGFAAPALRQIAPVTLREEGEDYAVSVTYGPEAALPADSRLTVREIEPGTEEYALYSGQTEAMLNQNWEKASFARFFDISFSSGNNSVEPAAPIDVQISFAQTSGKENMQAVQFDQDGAQRLRTEAAEDAVSFSTGNR